MASSGRGQLSIAVIRDVLVRQCTDLKLTGLFCCIKIQDNCRDCHLQNTSPTDTPVSAALHSCQIQKHSRHVQLQNCFTRWFPPSASFWSCSQSTLAGYQQNQHRAFSSRPVPDDTKIASVPTWLLPYVHLSRLHKPVGSWLLAWPCFWSIGMSTAPGCLPDVYLLSLFGTGALLLRGAGCTINDMWDRDLDGKVTRTKYRPLASGKLSMVQATAWLGGQLSLGLIILLQLNDMTKLLGVASLPLVVAYPAMKRITVAPQLFLGLTINWGAFMGYCAATGTANLPATLPLYLSSVCWTLMYDTVYAHMDRVDDEAAGIKSTARLLGHHTKPVLTGLAVSMAALQVCAGAAIEAGPMLYLGMLAGSGHVLWQVHSVKLDDAADCLSKFKSNVYMGALPMAGIVADRLLAGM